MFECRWGVVCWGSAAEDLARGTVYLETTGAKELRNPLDFCEEKIHDLGRLRKATRCRSVCSRVHTTSNCLVFDFKLYTKPSFIAIYIFHLVSIYVGA